MKQCIICKVEKELEDFYKHSETSDGRLGKCKECCKTQAKERQDRLSKDPAWMEQERERGREKYKRLGENWSRPTQEAKRAIIRAHNKKYPEKLKARSTSAKLPRSEGNELHHWSYNEAHRKDVIELSISDHAFLHRHIFYDEDLKLYRNEYGAILSKEDHINTLKQFKGEN